MGVRCGDDFQNLPLVFIDDQPRVAAAELSDGCFLERFQKARIVAKRIFDEPAKAAVRLAAAIGPQTAPKKIVIPYLGGIVENFCFLRSCATARIVSSSDFSARGVPATSLFSSST